MKFRKTPDITLQKLKKFKFEKIGKFQGFDTYKKRIEIPFSINPFRKVLNPNARDSMVLTAHVSHDLTSYAKSEELLYIVGINAETSITEDCILIYADSVETAVNIVKKCYNDHIEYGNFILEKQKKKKKKIQIIKTIKNIFKI
tara:strand:+ start:322 stop:753 length:432 start_codon:yes stop_codon:yes gene_type:complete